MPDKYALRDTVVTDKEGLGKYTPLLRSLLAARGIGTLEDAEVFLHPSYEDHVHDPFLLSDMDRAVSRILQAIDRGERIAIWSDYDADGIPGGALLYDFFKRAGVNNFENYIPHRHDEGYGLNIDGVKEILERGAKLLITVDCGIADVDAVSFAEDSGLNVIITDHHTPQADLPKAYAIINPKKKDCAYPFDMLCGAGVAFKLVQALLASRDFGIKEGQEKWFLDLVGLATLSDMVPLTGENRVFAHFGLKVLRKSPRPGIMKLLRRLNIRQEHITEDDIGFMIAPRINAASRMGVPDDAFHLLTTDDMDRAEALSSHLDSINNERKGVVSALVKEIRKKTGAKSDSPVLVAGNPDWRPALLGLVAGSLSEETGKPVFLWGRDGGSVLKGSCRSSGDVHLVRLMEEAREHLLEFGGHAQAGGFSVSNEKVHFLEEALIEAHTRLRDRPYEREKVWIDGTLSLDDVNWQTYKSIEVLAPFGVGNPKPVFIFEGVSPVSFRAFGKSSNHLEIVFENQKGARITAIAFFKVPSDFAPRLESSRFNLVAGIEKSMFRNFPELRLRIIDILSA